ncbi:MAG: TIGR03067 domain-containing protein [Planctomycetes bacterium]|nr:TIGR03067 domain-containing protein [Planctomycetota bacterium]
MKYLACLTPFLVAGIALLRAGEPSDLDRMQGTWVVVSLNEKGKPIAADETKLLEFTIEKDTFTAFDKGKVVVKYQIKLDSTKTPRQIDFTYLVGEDKGKTEPGIYAFDKDQLKFVLNEDKKDRPTVFEGKETEAYSVLVLKKKPK